MDRRKPFPHAKSTQSRHRCNPHYRQPLEMVRWSRTGLLPRGVAGLRLLCRSYFFVIRI